MLQHYLVKYCTPPATQQERMKFIWENPKSLYRQKKLIRMEGITAQLIKDIAA
jgi:5-methylthioribose kinase